MAVARAADATLEGLDQHVQQGGIDPMPSVDDPEHPAPVERRGRDPGPPVFGQVVHDRVLGEVQRQLVQQRDVSGHDDRWGVNVEPHPPLACDHLKVLGGAFGSEGQVDGPGLGWFRLEPGHQQQRLGQVGGAGVGVAKAGQQGGDVRVGIGLCNLDQRS